MNKARSFSVLSGFVVAFLLVQLSFASTVIVGTCKVGVQFATIQLAINASPSGTTIDICPNTYLEQLSINKNLTLTGISAGTSDASVVVPPSGGLVANGNDILGNPVAAQIFVQNATSATISHLVVDGTGNGLSGCGAPNMIGIYFENSAGRITDNVVRNQLMDPADQGCQLGLAINVESDTGSPAVTISNNSVRNYDKNGITASGPGTGGGPAVTVTANTVVGLGATSVIAQNGIQIGYGATGSVTGNNVADDIYTGPLYGSSGILIYASPNITVTGNTVDSTQLGIVPATDPTYGNANGTVIKSNHVNGTQTFDAIDLCSDGNTAEMNVIYGSAQSAIHLDDSCTPSTGSNNTATGNTINEACAGILLGTGSGDTISPNTFMNVTNTTLAGDSCTPAAGRVGKHHSVRPSAYRMKR